MLNFSKKVNTDKEKIKKLLTRNVEEVFVLESLEKKLLSGKRLNIKLGFDPTGSKIHIGRAVILRKLKEFQDLGHNIIFIVGNFTAQIGDPSDKLEKRPMLSDFDVEKNLKNYKNQIGKILDLKKVSFKYNSDWLSKLKFKEITKLAESFTVSQMISRRNFKDRLDRGGEISLREFMYPLMQGYDSVMVDADVEIGGFDQLFNLKAGRIIQKYYGKTEQDILTTTMLEGTDGRKMSTSWGNVINIIDEPSEIFGKIMSLRDDLIIKYFRVCTDFSEEKIAEFEANLLSQKINPKDLKIELGKEIVKMYHGEKDAISAVENFEKTFSRGGIPENFIEIKASVDQKIVDILIKEKIVISKNDWRRLIDGGAILKIISDSEKQKINDPNYIIKESGFYRIGKKRFVKIVV
ncbi:MAG TPA: tyrosine--tRNA ligase [Candidatus Paceibacterota bacterium]|nr:tyrosine--tRNA ligase [Candidatus Paceibacterota bacterium]HMP18984.1 tyrosine--tRNA ligase [Candidatus Paceibacterota bacterium]HMP85241.1 tyrosine--tRNA ligase [Candidatus Paceibacterota bacterium]